MKNQKNEIEQELDRKEFENEIGRDLASRYHQLSNQEKLMQGKNKYVIGVTHFFVTIAFFEVFYWLMKALVNGISLGFTAPFFELLFPSIHFVFLIMAIYSAYSLKSPIIYILKLMPNGWS
jgi:hypothetical protein